MGRAKEQWMRQCDEGWQSVGEKFVCPFCVGDYAIKAFIEEKAQSQNCNYCNRRFKINRAAAMDDVISFIA